MLFYKSRAMAFRRGRLADPIRHINGVEIAGVQEPVDGIEIDVVGVHMILLFPAYFAHCRSAARTPRLGTNDVVLAIRFIPYRHHGDAILGSHPARPQLCARLMGKAISTPSEFLLRVTDIV